MSSMLGARSTTAKSSAPRSLATARIYSLSANAYASAGTSPIWESFPGADKKHHNQPGGGHDGKADQPSGNVDIDRCNQRNGADGFTGESAGPGSLYQFIGRRAR